MKPAALSPAFAPTAPLVCVFALAAPAAAADLVGTVRYEGADKPANSVPVHVHKEHCGTAVPDESLVVSKDRALANVVVVLEGELPPSDPTAKKAEVTLDQKGCRFVPHVQAAEVGAQLVATNSDGVFHNARGSTGFAKTAFNVVLPRRGQQKRVTLEKAERIELKCDAGHTWMQGWLHVFEHRFFAVSDAEGRFAIRDVPPGKYRLKAIHERLGERLVEVTVPGGGDAAAPVVVFQ
jgi:hypothetical protein